MRVFDQYCIVELVNRARYLAPTLGPSVVPFDPFLVEGSPTKIDYI